MTLQFWGKLFKGIFVESRDSMLRTTSTVLPVFLYYSRRSFRPDDTPFQLSSSTSSFEMDFVWRYIVNIHFPFQCQYFPTYSCHHDALAAKTTLAWFMLFISFPDTCQSLERKTFLKRDLFWRLLLRLISEKGLDYPYYPLGHLLLIVSIVQSVGLIWISAAVVEAGRT